MVLGYGSKSNMAIAKNIKAITCWIKNQDTEYMCGTKHSITRDSFSKTSAMDLDSCIKMAN
jgi:hypothetical protein